MCQLGSIAYSGWSSNSSYAMLGAMRAIAQMVSYEVSIGLIIIGDEMTGDLDSETGFEIMRLVRERNKRDG